MNDKLYFETVKEKGDGFLVKYNPPSAGFLFASLSIIYVNEVALEDVVREMEIQNKKWIECYPIAIMASAFNNSGDLINLSPVKPESHLMTLVGENGIENHWKLLKDSELPTQILDEEYLRRTYSDIAYRTQEELKTKAYENAKSTRHIKALLIFWAVFVPVIISVAELFSPIWVAVIALVYSFWKAYQKWQLLTGRRAKTKAEIEKEENERQMEHHHYHCELNPDGFIRLRNENFEKMEKKRILNEYESA